MNKKQRLMLDTVSEIDEKIIEKNSQRRYALMSSLHKRRSRNKWLIGGGIGAVGVLAACILLFTLILPTLTPIAPPAGGKQAPVYEGMTVSHQAPVIEGAYLPLDGITLSNSDRIYTLDNSGNNGNNGNNGNHFGNDKKPIKDAIAESLQIVGSPEGYFAEAGEIIYITVHFDNPDLFEIWSFTLAGQPKQVGMEGFVVGLDLQTVTVPMQVPADAEGVIEYTIDAIKYVDGEEFKDVRMEGDDTVRVTVRPKDQPTASVTGETVGFNEITLSLNLTDPKALIAATEGGKLYAMLYDGEEIIAQKELTLTDTTVTFDSLATNTLYQYAIVAVYDALDGQGTVAHILAETTFYCEPAYSFLYGEAGEITGIVLSDREYASSNALEIVFPETDSNGNPITKISLDLAHLNLPQWYDSTSFLTYILIPLGQLLDDGTITEADYTRFISRFNDIDASVLPDVTKLEYYKKYPFLKAAADMTWYAFDGSTLDDNFDNSEYFDCLRIFRLLQENGLDFNAAAAESKALLESRDAYGTWMESKHYFLAVQEEKQLSFRFPPTLEELAIENALFDNVNTEWENGVGYFENWAFASESSVVNVSLRPGTVGIGKYAFIDRFGLTSIQIPDTVKAIGSNAFTGTSLTSIRIPDSVTYLGGYAFQSCFELSTVDLGSGIIELSAGLFNNCSKLTNITFFGTKAEWRAINKDVSLSQYNIVVHCTDGDVTLTN